MAGGGEFIQSLGALLGLTAIFALLLSYLRQSTIIAFIAVGVIVNSLGVEPDTGTLGHISEVGILILLFMAGLEVDLGAFLKNWRTAAIIGVGQIACSTGFFAAMAPLVLPVINATVTVNSCVYFGLCLCFSSTILVLGYLKNTKSMGTLYGQLCLGTLVLQDAASVLGIAVLGGLQEQSGGGTCRQVESVDCTVAGEDVEKCADLGMGCTMDLGEDDVFTRFLAEEKEDYDTTTSGCKDACASLDPYSSDFATACASLGSACIYEEGEGGTNLAIPIMILFSKLLAAMVIFFILEKFVLDRMFSAFARSLELLYLGALGYATGMAAIAVTVGFSGEITAFLAGVSLTRLPYKMHIETKMEPIKSLGVAVFFLSLGLQLELGREMVEALPIGFGLAFFTLFATLPLFAALGVPAGLKSHTVFMLGLLMNQISEFSLILCTLCVRAKVFEPVVLTVMTVAAVVSIIISSMGHAYIDAIYVKAQRWACLKCLDNRRARKLLKEHKKDKRKGNEDVDLEQGPTASLSIDTKQGVTTDDLPPPSPLLHRKPANLEDSQAWAFEDQLKLRTTEHLQNDLKEMKRKLEEARESMSATADEKRLQLSSMNDSTRKLQLYGRESNNKEKGRQTIIRHSHESDIMHGMIEGYVVVDHELVFCTLRAGRMLFWRDQHDVGHTPPASVWDVSGMHIIKRSGGGDDNDDDMYSVDDSHHGRYNDDEMQNPWEWTIVLGHIHRREATSPIEDDVLKLAIHGLEGQSDHDADCWNDALSVATSTLNPLAMRLAHIREELYNRRTTQGTVQPPLIESKMNRFGSYRNEIICIGYNEMFPAVLALADALGKEVVVVEYDPMKLNTIEKLYSEERRRADFREKNKKKSTGRSSPSPQRALMLGSSTPSPPPSPSRPRRVSSGANLQALDVIQEPSPQQSESSQPSMPRPRRANSGGNMQELEPIQEPPGPQRLILESSQSSMARRVNSGENLLLLGSKSQSMRTPRRVRMMSSPTGTLSQKGFWGMSHSSKFDTNSSDDDVSINGEEKIKGVKCEYADIHDPECWEELEMDKAFMVISTMKGARHAEKVSDCNGTYHFVHIFWMYALHVIILLLYFFSFLMPLFNHLLHAVNVEMAKQT